MKHFIIKLGTFLILLLLIVEVFFRTVIPASNQPFYSQDKRFMIMKFDTTGSKIGKFSTGRLAEYVVPWRVNNDGWNSGIDYAKIGNRKKDLVAVIGDSYVEGFYVKWSDHFASRLSTYLHDKYDVYAFGASGMPFSQYILTARYLKEMYGPKYVICYVGRNDFVGSIANQVRNPISFQLFRDENDSLLEKMPQIHKPSVMRFAYYSAFIRYLIANTGMTLGMASKDNQEIKPNNGQKNQKENNHLDVARYILSKLYVENPGTEFIFLIDGSRQAIYENTDKPTSIDEAVILKQAIDELGGHYVDMNDRFYSDYKANHILLNFPDNYHWNARANDLVAQELAALFRQLSEQTKTKALHKNGM